MQCLTKNSVHFFPIERDTTTPTMHSLCMYMHESVCKTAVLKRQKAVEKKKNRSIICIRRTEFMIISCGLRKFMVENRCKCIRNHCILPYLCNTGSTESTIKRPFCYFSLFVPFFSLFLCVHSQLVFIDMMCRK